MGDPPAGNILDFNRRLEAALVALIESQQQAGSDFCGAQRDWHVPRLNTAFLELSTLFPVAALRAMEKVRDPYGNLIMEK